MANILSEKGQWRWDEAKQDWVPNTQSSAPATTSGGNINSDAFKKAALLDLLKTGGKNLSNLKAAQDIISPKPSAAEEKTTQAKANADRILTQLEDLYYGGKGEEGDLEKGRVGGVGASLMATLGINTPLNVYKDLLKSIRPTLAKAAGDAGNLALQEQIMAGKVIPTEFATPAEALKKFKTVRARFDLPERDISGVSGPPKTQLDLSFPNLMKLLGTAKNYPQILQKTGQEIQQGGPLAKPSPELTQMVGGGPLEQVLTSQGAAGEVASPLLIAGLLKRGGASLLKKLSPGRQIAEGVAGRTGAAQSASQLGKSINGKELSTAVERELGGAELNKVPQAARAKVGELLAEFKKEFSGKIDPVKAVQRLEATTSGGTFTKMGSISSKAASQFEAAVNRALKAQFSEIAPEVLKGQAQIATGKTLQDIFNPKSISRGVVGGVATAGALGAGYGLLRLLGIGGNQGNYYGAGQ